MGQKRKRQALSCVDCRRRKVKCDRTYPVCDRCQKNNNAEHCTYVSHTGLEASLPTPSEDGPEQYHGPSPQVAPSGEPYVLEALREMSPHMEVQSRRTAPSCIPQLHQPTNNGMMRNLFGGAAQLENFANSPGSRPSPVVGVTHRHQTDATNPVIQPNAASDFNKVMVRGQNFSTHYYGPSFAISMLLQFEELSKFVKGMLCESTSFDETKTRMAATRGASKKSKRKFQSFQEADFASMIPDRSVTDTLVDHYMSTFETTYRILHVPTFRKDYEAYWQNPSAAKQEFVVVLLLVISSVYCVVPGEPQGFVGRSAARREVASRWIETCQSWLDEQSHKHISLPHFQAHILVFVGKTVNCIKIKREWMATGQLIRFAMAVGMHREPSLLSKKIDVFYQEMRRRLWYTIVELDLLTTIARGMPPTVDSFNWDCRPPQNLDDEDFDVNSTQLPPSKSRSTFTRSSFLNLAAESLPSRIEIIGRINSIGIGLELEAVMQYDSRLRIYIDAIPDWKGEKSATFAQNLSSLLLYDYVLILHIPFASQSQNKAKSFYSVASKRDISFKTLKLYTYMSDLERLFLFNIRDDHCRATLALSHDMVNNMKTDITPDATQVLNFMEIMVETNMKRFSSLGQGFHTFWITLSAYNLLRWKVSGSPSSLTFARDAASRVSELFNNVVDNQVPMPLPNGDMPNSTDNFQSVNIPTLNEPQETMNLAFPGFEHMDFFSDPFSDMNFDLSTVWNLDAGWT